MRIRELLVLSAAALVLMTGPGQAGPCSDSIARMQSVIDARLAAMASRGPGARQSTDAQLHRQPTPRSIAEAEASLGDILQGAITSMQEAMTRARAADAAGDKAACDHALAEVQKLVGQQ